MKVTLVKEKKSNQQRKFNDSSALSLEHISEKLKTLKPLTILKNVNIYIIFPIPTPKSQKGDQKH